MLLPQRSTRTDTLFPYQSLFRARLYEELIAHLRKALAGKRHLFTSATGSISSLPLGILVTEKPLGVDGDPAALRTTRWFADKAAIVQLPSLQSLQLLRAVEIGSASCRERGGQYV